MLKITKGGETINENNENWGAERNVIECRSESENFEEKNVKASAARARKALMELTKAAKVRRVEIQDRKNNL